MLGSWRRKPQWRAARRPMQSTYQIMETAMAHPSPVLTEEFAAQLAQIALSGITTEYPTAPGHVLLDARDLRRPRELHPAFYGCFDWHSAVHGHWLLAHLANRFPDLREAAAIRRVLGAHLAPKNLLVEARYLERHPGFERPYGWAWTLKLACELPESRGLRALAEVIEARYLQWLPKQAYPIRSGTHTNTAFGLAFA